MVTSVDLTETVAIEGDPLVVHGAPSTGSPASRTRYFDLFDSHHWVCATVTVTRDDCR